MSRAPQEELTKEEKILKIIELTQKLFEVGGKFVSKTGNDTELSLSVIKKSNGFLLIRIHRTTWRQNGDGLATRAQIFEVQPSNAKLLPIVSPHSQEELEHTNITDLLEKLKQALKVYEEKNKDASGGGLGGEWDIVNDYGSPEKSTTQDASNDNLDEEWEEVSVPSDEEQNPDEAKVDDLDLEEWNILGEENPNTGDAAANSQASSEKSEEEGDQEEFEFLLNPNADEFSPAKTTANPGATTLKEPKPNQR